MSEVLKLQYIFKQKEIERETVVKNRNESDAEHIYGCLILSEYFLSKESMKHLNKQRIFEIFLFHDLTENETGDISAYKKTEEDKIKEREAVKIVENKVPKIISQNFASAIKEYEEQTTTESKFCKAIDKLEPVIQMVGKLDQVKVLGITRDMVHSKKDKYIKEFPEIEELYKEALDLLFRDNADMPEWSNGTG